MSWDTRNERLEIVLGMMRSLEWKRGESPKRLAEQWGVTDKYVREISAEAWRIVRREMTDPDEVTGKITVALERVIDTALEEMRGAVVATAGQNGDPMVLTLDPNKARKSIVEAGRVWSSLAGAGAPQRIRLEEQSAEETEESLLTAVQILVSRKPELISRVRAILDGAAQ